VEALKQATEASEVERLKDLLRDGWTSAAYISRIY
jgi:hypothetical protein